MSALLDDATTWSEFGQRHLDRRIAKAVTDTMGLQRPTLVQSQGIPVALEGKDLLCKARTGSGKTLCYAVPLVQRLLTEAEAKGSHTPLSGLVLVPTKELIVQVHGVISSLLAFCFDILSAEPLLSGQKYMKAELPTILVTTPSSLLSLTKERSGTMRPLAESLRVLIVDEADLMFSFGYEEDMRAMCAMMPSTYQAMLVSATLSEEVEQLKGLMLHKPVLLKLEEPRVTAKLSQFYLVCHKTDKYLILYTLLKLQLISGKTLMFVNSIETAYRLKILFEKFSINAAVLNAELPHASRQNIIQSFNQSLVELLIATDDGFGDEEDGHQAIDDGEEEEEEMPEGEEGEAEVEEPPPTKKKEKKAKAAAKEKGKKRKLAEAAAEEGEDKEAEGKTTKLTKKAKKKAAAAAEKAREEAKAAEAEEAKKASGKKKKKKVDVPEPEKDEKADEEDDKGEGEGDEEQGEEEDDGEDDVPVPSATVEVLRAGAGGETRRRLGRRRGARADEHFSLTRGVDLQGVSTVINADIPQTVRAYVHRVGRCARGGASGTALTICTQEEEPTLQRIIRVQASASGSGVLRPLPMQLTDAERFRYRVEDMSRGLTKKSVAQYRARELQLEALNSEKLKAYFEEHPDEKRALQRTQRQLKERKSVRQHLRHLPGYLVPEQFFASATPVQQAVRQEAAASGAASSALTSAQRRKRFTQAKQQDVLQGNVPTTKRATRNLRFTREAMEARDRRIDPATANVEDLPPLSGKKLWKLRHGKKLRKKTDALGERKRMNPFQKKRFKKFGF